MIPVPVLRAGSTDAFPPAYRALDEPNGLLAIGGDLSPARLLEAYRHAIFPWFSDGEPILWWSPDPRMVLATARIHVATRLRRWLKRCPWEIRADTNFEAVMRACAEPRSGQRGTWINRAMIDAYTRLHDLGHAHSVEIYDGERLIGGIYGVAIGRMFFGESMFSRETNASKLALIALCRTLHAGGCELLDAQVSSAHLITLGAFEMPRNQFVMHVAGACGQTPALPAKWQAGWQLRHASDCFDS